MHPPSQPARAYSFYSRLHAPVWIAGLVFLNSDRTAAVYPAPRGHDPPAVRPAPRGMVGIASFTPSQHDDDGGSIFYVSGTGFSPGLEVWINGQPATDVRHHHPTIMAGRVPANPPGTYDVEIRTASGAVLASLPNGAEYVAGLIPGPEDVVVTRLNENQTLLRWSNRAVYDQIEIRRDTQTLVLLPGDATQYVDVHNCPGCSTLRYEFRGLRADGRNSFLAVADWRPLDCSEKLGLGCTGRAADFSLSVVAAPGVMVLGEHQRARVAFQLASPVDAVRVWAWAARLSVAGSLRGRVSTVADPDTILADFPLTDLPFNPILQQWTDGQFALAGGDVPAGEYQVEFYCAGVNPGQFGNFAVRADAASEAAENVLVAAALPRPPYPLVRIEPICGDPPPMVIAVVQEVVELIDPDDPLWPPGGFFGGLAPQPDRMVVLRCDALDLPPGRIVEYEWDFGDGEVARSGSSRVFKPYADYATYSVCCTVRDNSGSTDTGCVQVIVTPVALPPAPGSPPVIGALTTPDAPDGDPDSLTILPDVSAFLAASVPHAYDAQVIPAHECCIDSVRMRLLEPGTATVVFDQPAARIAGNACAPGVYRATFNTDELPDLESYDLEVVALDNLAAEGRRTFPSLALCDRPPLLSLAPVQSTLSYRVPDRTYELSATVPPNPLVNEPFVLLPGILELENRIEAGATFRARLERHRWHPLSLRGFFHATLLSVVLADREWGPLDLDGPISIDCDRLAATYELADPVNIYNVDFEWVLLPETVLYSGLVGPVLVEARVSVDAGLGIDVTAFPVIVTLSVTPPNLDATLGLNPSLTAWARGDLTVEVFGGVISATGSLRPSLGITVPIVAHIVDDSVDLDASACFDVALHVKVRACVDLIIDEACYSTGWMTIFDENFGPGCPGGAAVAAPCRRGVARRARSDGPARTQVPGDCGFTGRQPDAGPVHQGRRRRSGPLRGRGLFHAGYRRGVLRACAGPRRRKPIY